MTLIKIMLPILMFVLGTCLASFGNVLVSRYPNWSFKGERAHSTCQSCGHKLAWYDLFPIFSYVCLGGKCRYCKNKIPANNLLVELSGGIMFLVTYLLYVYVYPNYSFTFDINPLSALKFICFSFTLLLVLCSALIDVKHKEAPFSFSIAIVIISIAYWGLSYAFTGNYSLMNILGLAIPFVLFTLIYVICVFLLKIEPLGITDIIIFCALGLLMDIANLLIIVIVSTLLCAIIESAKIKKTGKKELIPFIPYIFVGFLTSVLFGQLIIDGYMKLIGA